MQIKAPHRAFVCLVFFTIVGTLSSSASSLVCSAGPTALVHGNNANQVIYTCTIPANSVALSKAIRLTVNALGSTATGELANLLIYFNGVSLGCCGATSLINNYFEITIMRTGATTGEWIGIIPDHDSPTTSVETSGIESADPTALSGLSWGSAQTLQFVFEGNTSAFAQGQMFIVELLN